MRRLVVDPKDLKNGDVVIGARVKSHTYESDDESQFTLWGRKIVGSTRTDTYGSYTPESIHKSHYMCEFLVERAYDPNTEPVYYYVKGQGWMIR